MIRGFQSPYCLNSFLYTATFFAQLKLPKLENLFPKNTMIFDLNVCIVDVRVNKALLSKKLNS